MGRPIELAKLARVFGDVAPPGVASLDGAGLRELRDLVSARLYDDARPMLTRVAKASKLLPNSSTAKVGEKIFGPLLCAHVASLLAPEHALGVALHMPDAFLASVAAQLDPRGAPRVIATIPTERIVAVARVLVARGDYMTLGRFVDFLTPETITAVIDDTADELHLLEIARFVDRAARLAELVELLPPPRLRAMTISAARDAARWPELVAIAHVLPAPIQRRIADHVIDALRTGELDFLTARTS